MKTVYKLELDGGSYLIAESTADLMPEFENSAEIGEKFELSKIEMTQEEIDNLPEFDGF